MSCSQYIPCGAIVLLKLYNFRLRKILFKVKYISYVGSPPLVYALVVIADHAKVFVGLGEQFNDLILYVIGILIFVYHYICKSVLIVLQYFRVISENVICISEQIVKIHRIVVFKLFLILFIYVVYYLCLRCFAFQLYSSGPWSASFSLLIIADMYWMGYSFWSIFCSFKMFFISAFWSTVS